MRTLSDVVDTEGLELHSEIKKAMRCTVIKTIQRVKSELSVEC